MTTYLMIWNVYIGSFNKNRIETWNVFDHWRFEEDCQKNYKKNGENREAFEEQLRRDLQYYYWSKCEWEIILDHWPHFDQFKEEKIDVFDQVTLNWGVFADYVWNNRKEFA